MDHFESGYGLIYNIFSVISYKQDGNGAQYKTDISTPPCAMIYAYSMVLTIKVISYIISIFPPFSSVSLESLNFKWVKMTCI